MFSAFSLSFLVEEGLRCLMDLEDIDTLKSTLETNSRFFLFVVFVFVFCAYFGVGDFVEVAAALMCFFWVLCLANQI